MVSLNLGIIHLPFQSDGALLARLAYLPARSALTWLDLSLSWYEDSSGHMRQGPVAPKSHPGECEIDSRGRMKQPAMLWGVSNHIYELARRCDIEGYY